MFVILCAVCFLLMGVAGVAPGVGPAVLVMLACSALALRTRPLMTAGAFGSFSARREQPRQPRHFAGAFYYCGRADFYFKVCGTVCSSPFSWESDRMERR